MQGSEDAADGWHEKYIVRRYLNLDAIIFYEGNYFHRLSCKLVMKVKCLREVLFKAELSRLTRMAEKGEKLSRKANRKKEVFSPVSKST